MKSQSETANSSLLKVKLQEDLSVVCAEKFQAILHIVPDFLPFELSHYLGPNERSDNYDMMDKVLKLLRRGYSRDRLVSRSLFYLKAHQNFLRHSCPGVDRGRRIYEKDVINTINVFNDLLVATNEIRINNPSKSYLFDDVADFACSYHLTCVSHSLEVPSLLTPEQLEQIASRPSLPPPDQTLVVHKHNQMSASAKEYVPTR
jgi:hypothetical protein